MKLQKSDLILYGAAAFSALIAVAIVYGYVESRVAEAQAGNQETVKTVTVVEKPDLKSVVVANRDLFRGEEVSVEDLKVLKVPVEGVTTAGVVLHPEKVVGKVVKQRIYSGEWLMMQKFGSHQEGSGRIESILETGMRAMRIPVSAESGLLGMLNPNDHVDVISVFKSADGKNMVSRTILQNIEVLAIGQANRMKALDEEKRKDDDNYQTESISKSSMVALNVTPVQAEQLALAISVGSIHLALRGGADIELVDTAGVKTASFEKTQTLKSTKSDRPIRASTASVIQVMEGNHIKEVVVR